MSSSADPASQLRIFEEEEQKSEFGAGNFSHRARIE